jgi:hypothetical protein
MDIQVNKHQLERVVIKWLDKHYGDLTLRKHEDYPNDTFFIDSENQILLQFSTTYWEVFVSDNYIWSHLVNFFHLHNDDVKSIIPVWLKETYKMDLFNLRVRKIEGNFVYPKDDKSQAPKGRIKFI